MSRQFEWPTLFGGILFAVLGITGAGAAVGYGLWRGSAPGEGLFPFAACVGMALMGIGHALWGHKGAPNEMVAPDDDIAMPDDGPLERRRLVIYLAGLAGFAFLLPYLGYWLVTSIALVLILKFAERSSWTLTLSTTIATLLATAILFEWLLGVNLPNGTLF